MSTTVAEKETNRLTTQELITLGILNALALAVYTVLSLALHLIPGVLGMFRDAAVSLFMGGIYMLMAIKVPKPGVFTLNGILFGVVWFLFGYPVLILIGSVLGGAAADAVAMCFGRYRQTWSLWVAYILLRLGMVAGLFLPFYLWTEQMARRLVEIGWADQAYAHTYASYFTARIGMYMLLANIAGALIGAAIGWRLIQRHLVRAGVV